MKKFRLGSDNEDVASLVSLILSLFVCVGIGLIYPYYNNSDIDIWIIFLCTSILISFLMACIVKDTKTYRVIEYVINKLRGYYSYKKGEKDILRTINNNILYAENDLDLSDIIEGLLDLKYKKEKYRNEIRGLEYQIEELKEFINFLIWNNENHKNLGCIEMEIFDGDKNNLISKFIKYKDKKEEKLTQIEKEKE